MIIQGGVLSLGASSAFAELTKWRQYDSGTWKQLC